MMPLLLVLGPTGAGKTSVIRVLVDLDGRFEYIRPLTTRILRPGEIDKIHVSDEELTAADGRGEFVVVNSLYGARYATPWKPIRNALASGRIPVIDWPIGAVNVMESLFPGECLRCYLVPPDEGSLTARIRERDGSSDRVAEGLSEFREFAAGGFAENLDYSVISYDGAVLQAAQAVREGYLTIVSGRNHEGAR